MPCRDDYAEQMHAAEQLETVKQLEIMLCSACRELESQKYDFDKNPQLSNWWNKHKKEDAARELKEAKQRFNEMKVVELSKKPFNELTIEDKRFLRSQGLI